MTVSKMSHASKQLSLTFTLWFRIENCELQTKVVSFDSCASKRASCGEMGLKGSSDCSERPHEALLHLKRHWLTVNLTSSVRGWGGRWTHLSLQTDRCFGHHQFFLSGSSMVAERTWVKTQRNLQTPKTAGLPGFCCGV